MAEKSVKRKLAAILYADVAGYSRLTGEDEEGTHRRLGAAFDLISGVIKDNDGQVVHYAGDAVLADFGSVIAAVDCAVLIQRRLADSDAGVPDAKCLRFRVGVNLGEVIVDRDDIYGDGVNVAARLESLAEPGGICISDKVYQEVADKLDLRFEDLGPQRVKNIIEPVRAYRVRFDGARTAAVPGVGGAETMRQDIRFCTTSDGVSIAYSVVGRGPSLVKAGNWLNHLEYDWRSPIWSYLIRGLANDFSLVRYDPRGTGLSDWNVESISFEDWVSDLESVVDTVGLDRFSLLGISQGCAVSIAYAARHPERVAGLVLYGGFTKGRHKRGSPKDAQEADAMMTLIRHGWGRDNPAFRQVFTSLLIPDGTAEQMQWLNDLQRITTSPENALRFRQILDDIDVSQLLAQVVAPTLVLHCRDDAMVSFDEGRRIAAAIKDVRFIPLEGRNHLILEDEPAGAKLLEEIRRFVEQRDTGGGSDSGRDSPS